MLFPVASWISFYTRGPIKSSILSKREKGRRTISRPSSHPQILPQRALRAPTIILVYWHATGMIMVGCMRGASLGLPSPKLGMMWHAPKITLLSLLMAKRSRNEMDLGLGTGAPIAARMPNIAPAGQRRLLRQCPQHAMVPLRMPKKMKLYQAS